MMGDNGVDIVAKYDESSEQINAPLELKMFIKGKREEVGMRYWNN